MELSVWMEKNGWTLQDVSQCLQLDKSTICKYMKKERTPRLEVAVQIEEMTDGDVSCRDLLCD